MAETDHLETELATFEKHRETLEAGHKGDYVVIRGTEIVGTYPDCDTAARAAIERFGPTGPFLLRQIGRYAVRLSPAASLGYIGVGPDEAASKRS